MLIVKMQFCLQNEQLSPRYHAKFSFLIYLRIEILRPYYQINFPDHLHFVLHQRNFSASFRSRNREQSCLHGLRCATLSH